MALHRQATGAVAPSVNGNHKSGASYRLPEHSIDHEKGGTSRQSEWQQGESFDVLGRSTVKAGRGKRLGRSVKNHECSVGFLVVVLLLGILFTLLASYYLFDVGRLFTGEQDTSKSDDFFYHQTHSHAIDRHSEIKPQQEIVQHHMTSGLLKKTSTEGADSKTSTHNLVFRNEKHSRNEDAIKKVHFGLGDGWIGQRDSRDWDTDDRKREHVGSSLKNKASHSENGNSNLLQGIEKKYLSNSQGRKAQILYENLQKDESSKGKTGESKIEDMTSENLGLYNERGRKELRKYEEQFEADLKQLHQR